MPAFDRRPIAARETGWARRIASGLARSAITPNQISLLSVVFALIGSAALVFWPGPAGMVLCAACILLRLLCNLFDGMVAVEGGKGTPTGILYNEFPDRVADTMFIVALGHSAGEPWLGWLGASLAVGTAFVRVSGGALGLTQSFGGIMAKQQRMATMIAGCLLGAAETFWHAQRWALLTSAIVIAAGSAITCISRTRAIAMQLKARC